MFDSRNTFMLLYWTIPWKLLLTSQLTQLLLDRTVIGLKSHLTERILDRTVTLVNYSLTTATWVRCYFTELFIDDCCLTELVLHWTIPWRLLLDWASTRLNCCFTELLLDWTTWLNCCFTELLLDWTSTWLNCYYLTELLLLDLLLDWAFTWRNGSLTELLLHWTIPSQLLLDWTSALLNYSLTTATWLN